ncbi:MAG: XRE family transcriptional regulator [Pseudomonadota bacterium]
MAISAKDVFEKTMSKEERAAAKQRGAELTHEYKTLQDMRKAQDLTQVDIAKKLGISQDNVSRLEKRSDVLLSTLRGYVEAMGGKLTLVVEFPGRGPVLLDSLIREDKVPE